MSATYSEGGDQLSSSDAFYPAHPGRPQNHNFTKSQNYTVGQSISVFNWIGVLESHFSGVQDTQRERS